MEQLKSKEYTSIAKLMRGFLEEIELVPYTITSVLNCLHAMSGIIFEMR